jgi:hypothetical protein
LPPLLRSRSSRTGKPTPAGDRSHVPVAPKNGQSPEPRTAAGCSTGAARAAEARRERALVRVPVEPDHVVAAADVR